MPGAAVTATPEQWRIVGRRVHARRVALGLSQDELGASRSVVSNLEASRQEKYARTSLAKIERSLGWAAGSIDLILDGGEPEEIRSPAAPMTLEERVARWEAELNAIRSERADLEERLSTLEQFFQMMRDRGWSEDQIEQAREWQERGRRAFERDRRAAQRR